MNNKQRGVDRRQSRLDTEVERRQRKNRRGLSTIAGQAIFQVVPFSTLERLAKHCDVRKLDPGFRRQGARPARREECE